MAAQPDHDDPVFAALAADTVRRPQLSPFAVTMVCLGLIVPLGWFPFVRGTRVPLLGFFDFGMHELGHLIGVVVRAPHTVVLLLGNGTQTLVPLGVAVVLWWKGERSAAAVAVAWAGSTLQDASVYIGDAVRQELFIIGTGHDWAQLLGPEHFDVLDRTDAIASWVNGAGLTLWVVAAAVLVWRAVHQCRWLDGPLLGP